jgi:hypothetical protein
VELEPLPKYGDHMTIGQFAQHISSGLFIDYDGHGEWATATHRTDVMIVPSEIADGSWIHAVPTCATHVIWYNK